MTATEEKTITATRSFPLDVFCAEDAPVSRDAVLRSIRQYRAVARKACAALACCEQAGADIVATDENVRVIPNAEAAREIARRAFAETTDKGGAEYSVYAFAAQEYPSAMSFVWSQMAREVKTVWRAKDPQYGKADRRYLVVNGARHAATFNQRGIPLKQPDSKLEIDQHKIVCRWDRELGFAEFKFRKLDGGRWAQLCRIASGEDGWKLGTCYLNERDGKLRIVVTYSYQIDPTKPDRSVALRVEFGVDPASFLRIAGNGRSDTVSAIDAIGSMADLQRRKLRMENRREACGSKVREWGDRKSWKRAQAVIEKLTEHRSNSAKTHNHAWTRRIVQRAISWGCGTIQIPKAKPDDLFGHPWQWAQFEQFLKYKAAEAGIEIEAVK